MNKLFWILGLAMVLVSCKKTEGEGGYATIQGKIYALDYNAELTNLREEYYAPDEDVYIVYGNDIVYSDDFKTHYDGSYRFDFLQKGTYTIYAYSKDFVNKTSSKLVAVKQTIEITEKDQVYVVPDITIYK